MCVYTKSFPLGFSNPTVKYVGESLGRPYLIGIVGRGLLMMGRDDDRGRGYDATAGPVVVFGGG